MKHLATIILVFIAATAAGHAGSSGSQIFRVSGIITDGDSDWFAIVETIEGRQRVVRQGDKLGSAEVVEILRSGVLVRVSNGERLIPLSRGIDDPSIPDTSVAGVSVVAFRELAHGRLESARSGEILGLGDLNHVSQNATIVSINDQPVSSPEEAVDMLEKALNDGEDTRIILNGETSLPVVYVAPLNRLEADSVASQ